MKRQTHSRFLTWKWKENEQNKNKDPGRYNRLEKISHGRMGRTWEGGGELRARNFGNAEIDRKTWLLGDPHTRFVQKFLELPCGTRPIMHMWTWTEWLIVMAITYTQQFIQNSLGDILKCYKHDCVVLVLLHYDMASIQEERTWRKFCGKQEETAAEIHKRLCKAYSNETCSKTMFDEWHKHFQCRRNSTNEHWMWQRKVGPTFNFKKQFFGCWSERHYSHK